LPTLSSQAPTQAQPPQREAVAQSQQHDQVGMISIITRSMITRIMIGMTTRSITCIDYA
jgi:hypothetical protein